MGVEPKVVYCTRHEADIDAYRWLHVGPATRSRGPPDFEEDLHGAYTRPMVWVLFVLSGP